MPAHCMPARDGRHEPVACQWPLASCGPVACAACCARCSHSGSHKGKRIIVISICHKHLCRQSQNARSQLMRWPQCTAQMRRLPHMRARCTVTAAASVQQTLPWPTVLLKKVCALVQAQTAAIKLAVQASCVRRANPGCSGGASRSSMEALSRGLWVARRTAAMLCRCTTTTWCAAVTSALARSQHWADTRAVRRSP